ncbi:hypothetical protein [Prescottella agglutinans]|uniref:Minor tail protein n=1 Tax=Prescottella agglutinans TaxID=1644129 RepID=A0ABT6M5F0_9NOCA|nr:hypothetical protein [Prescottella agglutinans]MDH6279532.1 hypothetical protein [Prescottella agglutinans]
MAVPVFGSLVPLVGRVNTSVLAINQVRWFKWSLFYQEYVEQGYADIHDPTEPGVVVALKIDGTAATYSALPTTGLTPGVVYVVGDTGRAYVWNGTAWPPVNAGIAIQGPRGYTGNGVESVAVSGNSLVFHMTDGTDLPPVYLQVLADLQSSAAAATAARDAAIAARTGAESARDSASGSASDALAHRNAAQAARDDAKTHKDNAYTYAATAATAASQASAYRDSALQHRNDAQTAAATATTKATDAGNSATAAANSASTSSTKAGEATAAKTNAEQARDAAIAAKTGAEAARDQAMGGVVPDNGVTTPKIADGAVTLAKIANNSVDKDKITVGGVISDNLASGAVTDAKVATNAAIAQSKISGLVPALAKKADLDAAGKIVQAQLPALALTEYLGQFSSQQRMLADSAGGQRGDWCTRTDLGTDWQLIADDPTQLASWREHVYPASPVQSVAGRQGAVTLSVTDVSGAAPLASPAMTGSPKVNGVAVVVSDDARLTDARNTTVDKITDATTVGKNVLKAANGAAARSAISAGPVLVDRGSWSATATYQQGDVVTAGGARWYYTNPTASTPGAWNNADWVFTGGPAIGTTTDTAMRGDGIQTVASLPGSPIAGVLYCIPE